jgi:hypothetical protein
VEGIEEVQMRSSAGSYEQDNNPSGPLGTRKFLGHLCTAPYGDNDVRKEENE